MGKGQRLWLMISSRCYPKPVDETGIFTLSLTKVFDLCSYPTLYALCAMPFSNSVRRERWKK